MANIQATATAIADLNDEFRRRGTGGSRYITAGILDKGPAFIVRAIAEVAACSIVCDASSYRGHADRVVFAFSDLAAMTSVV